MVVDSRDQIPEVVILLFILFIKIELLISLPTGSETTFYLLLLYEVLYEVETEESLRVVHNGIKYFSL